jgi:3,4-dihydroxy 2-butanone 4-phosphate synthase / GTP cyclohydrolase II
MARREDLLRFAERYGNLPIVSIKELIEYRLSKEMLVEEVALTKLPTEFGEFAVHAFRSLVDDSEHLALCIGDLTENESSSAPLVRMHSECLTGDALFSLRCDCGAQLRAALAQIAQAGKGVLVYLRRHEGRGIGLLNKMKAYQLQDAGMDTVEANRHLGFQPDLRHYGIGAQILRSLGIKNFRLLTNNPKKIVGLDGYDLKVVERIPIEIDPNPFSQRYLEAKREKLGHLLLKEINTGSH